MTQTLPGRPAFDPLPDPLADAPVRARPFTVTHASVLVIAVPMTFAYLSVPLVGLVDTAVIGQLGRAALIGGIAIGAIIFDILFTSFNFLRSGTTGLTAQALGAGDASEQQAVLVRALILALGLGGAVLVLREPLIGVGLWLMQAGPDVDAAARTYLGVRIWATPLALANYVLIGWLLGLARAAAVLLLQTVFAAMNIGFSLLFVLSFGWGVAGVAWASVAAEAGVLVATVPFVMAALLPAARPSFRRILDRAAFLRIAAVNRDIMIRSICLIFAFAFFTRQGARLGDTVLAANAVLMHFFLISGYVLDGFATAAEQLAGRAVGARYRPAFDAAVRLTVMWGFAFAVALTLTYLAAGERLVALMTTAADVRALAGAYLVWAALTPLAGVLAFQMDGIFIGATWSRDMRNMMLLSVIVYLAVWGLAVPLIGNHGLWLALLVFLAARGVSLWRRLGLRATETFAGAAPAG